MTFSIVNSAITDQVIKALCNTLVHSLWQGLILAAIAGLIVIATKRASSALRYNLLISALCVFALGTLITFGVQLQKIDYTTAGNNQLVNTVQQNTVVVQAYVGHEVAQSGNLVSVISGYLNTYHNSIVLIWFLIICAKSIQLGVGLYGTYRLKSTQVIAAGGFWEERTKQLAAMLGIDQGIRLLESGLAKVPMVIGHLKPVILIPIGLLTALSAEEVEAILVHELAHIKRRDYLVNMLQSLMEIVFFFNPAVLWISQLIKTERENCCDDMALEHSSNKINYIRALVSCEEYQAAVPAYAMAFPGSKNTLLDRVKRMANSRNHSLNLYEKTVLAICLVVSGLCMSAFAEKENIKLVVHQVAKVFERPKLNPAQQAELTKQTELLNMQTAMIRKNTPLLSGNYAGLNLSDDTNRKLHVALNLNIAPMAMNISPLNIDPKINIVPNVNLAPMNIMVNVPAPDIHLAPMNLSVTSAPDIYLAPLNIAPKVNLSSLNVSPNISLAPLNINLGNLNIHDTIRYTNSVYMKRFREIARELFKMKILADTNRAGIRLNEKELVVNGVKLPEDIHKKIFDKFGSKESLNGFTSDSGNSYGANYNSSGNGNSYSNSYSSSGNGYSGGTHNSSGNSNTYSSSGSNSSSSSGSNSYSYSISSGSKNSSGGSYSYSDDSTIKKRPVLHDLKISKKIARGPATATPSTPSTPPTPETAPGVPPVPLTPRTTYNSSSYAPAAGYGQAEMRERARKDSVARENIIADMTKDGLITDRNNISFKITDKEFFVNDVKQSDAIFERYKKKYIPASIKGNSNWTWTYNYKK